MKLLLDTHAFLWLQTAPERLGEHLAVAEDPDTQLLLSAVTSWEIGIKYATGKLTLPDLPQHWVIDGIREIGAQPIAVEHAHALAVATLPMLHRDPFDRLLVAQALALDATLLTADAALAEYPVRTLLISRG